MASSLLQVLPSMQFGHGILAQSSPESMLPKRQPFRRLEDERQLQPSNNGTVHGLNKDEASPASSKPDSIAITAAQSTAFTPSAQRDAQGGAADKDLLLEGFLAQSVAALCLDDLDAVPDASDDNAEAGGQEGNKLPDCCLRVQVRQSQALISQALLLTPAYGGSQVWAPVRSREEGKTAASLLSEQWLAGELRRVLAPSEASHCQAAPAPTALKRIGASPSPDSPLSTCSSSRSLSSDCGSSPSSQAFSLSFTSTPTGGSASPLSVLSPRKSQAEATAARAAWSREDVVRNLTEMREALQPAQSEGSAWDHVTLPEDLLTVDELPAPEEKAAPQTSAQASPCPKLPSTPNPPLLPLPYPLPSPPAAFVRAETPDPSSFRSPPIGLLRRLSPVQQLQMLQRHLLAVAAAPAAAAAAAKIAAAGATAPASPAVSDAATGKGLNPHAAPFAVRGTSPVPAAAAAAVGCGEGLIPAEATAAAAGAPAAEELQGDSGATLGTGVFLPR